MQVWRMRTGISITLEPVDRRRLTTVARDRNAPHKHVWRAEIVLLSADGVGTNEIMRRTGKSKTCVWRWQERFMQAGYDGLLRDKTRPSRIPPLGADIAKRVVALTRTDPPASDRFDPLVCDTGTPGVSVAASGWSQWRACSVSNSGIQSARPSGLAMADFERMPRSSSELMLQQQPKPSVCHDSSAWPQDKQL
jgi:hypothetical protein